MYQNKHLKDILTGELDSRDFIGRYMYITSKCQQVEGIGKYEGYIFEQPVL